MAGPKLSKLLKLGRVVPITEERKDGVYVVGYRRKHGSPKEGSWQLTFPKRLSPVNPVANNATTPAEPSKAEIPA